jgi:integrase
MATFKPEVRMDNLRSDNTYSIRIRITHNRKVKRIPTSIYVDKKEVTKSGKIKNQQIIDQLEDIVREYRKKVTALSVAIEVMTIDELTEYLTKKDETLKVDFFEFSEKWIAKNKDKHGIQIFVSMLNTLEKFLGRRRLDFKEINYRFLKSFEEYLGQRRRLSLYMGKIRHLYNEAKLEYNDEEYGRILIPWSPFAKYSIPNIEPTKDRTLTAEQIRQIYELPYKPNRFPSRPCAYNVAKDVFILSFCLMGMNTADLYLCEDLTEQDGKITISYNRAKTSARRTDKARISVDVHPFLVPLFEKYRNPRKGKIFSFVNRYCDYTQLNKSVNKGLKEVGKAIGIDDLEFYAARHTFATIARNKLGYDKSTVGEALNHVEKENKITDIYIQKDFSIINKLNKEVIEYVFKGLIP